MITNKMIADQLIAYLTHQISLVQLVDWAETKIIEGGFETNHEKTIRDSLGKIGLADVNQFGLLWEDCEQLMTQLGYKLKIEADLVA